MDKKTAEYEGYVPVNIIVGRFQPLTSGHIKCAEEIYRKTGLKSVLCMIQTPANKVNPAKPFSTNQLSYMYANILATSAYPFIAGFMSVTSANIVANNQQLMNNGFIAASWSCGTDRYDSYRKMAQNYAKEANVLDGFKVYEIKRTKNDINATAIRYFISSNDYASFIKYTPFKVLNRQESRKCFDQLMVQLTKVLNNFDF